jgi:hypothetical protein
VVAGTVGNLADINAFSAVRGETRILTGGFVLKDLCSRNGSFLEGRQIVQAYLEPGDKISLGKTKLAIEQKSKPTEVEIAGADLFGELVGASETMRALFAASCSGESPYFSLKYCAASVPSGPIVGFSSNGCR